MFKRTKDDNQVAPSIQNASFIKIMDEGLRKDSNNSWVAPLPFKCPRQWLHNKITQLKSLMSLKGNFERKPEMKDNFLSLMEKLLENRHTKLAPPLSDEED